MKYLILGAGLQGRIAGYDILEYESDSKVIFADCSEESLELAKNRVKDHLDRASFEKFDIWNDEETISLMETSDVIVACLPHAEEYTRAIYERMIKVGGKRAVFSDYWLWKVHHEYDEKLKAVDGLCVPGLGISPGFGNICVGQLEYEFDKLEAARIYVGGFPAEKGVKPFDYMELFDITSLLDMYVNTSTVIEDGKFVEKGPLQVCDHIFIPGHGIFEAFWTDGLCSLEKNMMEKGLLKCDEVTLRYPGHVEEMRKLADLGFLDEEEIEIEGIKIKPRDFTQKIFEKLWVKESDIKDMSYLYVLGRGYKDGRYTSKAYELKTYSDDEHTGITSMELATAYPVSIAAMMLGKDERKITGVVDPEIAFIGDKFEEMVRELAKRGLSVYEYNF